MIEHQPVLLTEVIQGLNIKPEGIYLDLTIGRAGHASKIYEKLSSGRLIGFDQDSSAIEALKQWQKDRPRATIIHQNFSHVDQELTSLGIEQVDGILMDLGVSSPQFDVPERGFSYRFDGPLDMRMDLRQTTTAAMLVNHLDVVSLTQIFREYADETFAYPIAKAIIKRRNEAPFSTTFELVSLIKEVKPAKALKKKGHPAKQVFQALRIAVNQELEVLASTLSTLLKYLKLNGRLAIISFHSGEDRIVKQFFQGLTVEEGSRRGLSVFLPKPTLMFEKVKPYPVLPSEFEKTNNHRSESAVLRIIERIKNEK